VEGGAHSREKLAALFWPESDAPTGRAALRNTLTQLRAALTAPDPASRHAAKNGDHHLLIERDSVGFDFDSEYDLDLSNLQPHSAPLRGPGLPTTTQPIESLRTVVSLYRGDFLEGFSLSDAPAFDEWASFQREAWHRRMNEAFERLTAWQLERRELSEGIETAARWIAHDALNEAAHRRLMELHLAAGDREAARRAYETCRATLAKELNIPPAPETEALAERIRELVRTRTEPALRVVRPKREPFDNLPAPVTSFVGREAELNDLSDRLRRADVRLVTLTGPGGIGKTRLALQVAAELRADFADGLCFVSLAPLRDPALVPPTLAHVLGVSEAAHDPLQRVKSELRDRQMLLLLDNFESVLDAAPLLTELLQAAPGLKMLVTSRAVLHLYGEHEFPVPPLPSDPAVRLFTDRAQAVRPEFRITPANVFAVAEICTRLDGLPLAIELAAACVKLFPPAVLLARLEHGLHWLASGARDVPARHQTLRDAIAWSYDLLDEPERALFRRLAAFVGGCTAEAAEAVIGNPGPRSAAERGWGLAAHQLPNTIFDGLSSLVDKSLLKQVDTDGQPRFAMLETIRDYALEQLSASGEMDAIRRRHSAFFIQLAEASVAKILGAEQAEWLDRLSAEHDNLRSALTWTLSSEEEAEAEAGLRLAGALTWFWHWRGHWTEGRRWIAQALAHGPEPGAPAMRRLSRARALFGAGVLAWAQSDYPTARAHLEASLDLAPSGSDPFTRAHALGALGLVLLYQNEPAQAEPLLNESLALFRGLENPFGIGVTLVRLGIVAQLQSNWKHSEALYTESLALYRALGNTWGIAISLASLAEAKVGQREFDRADGLYAESIGLFKALNSPWYLALAVAGYAGVVAERGQLERAACLLASVDAAFTSLEAGLTSIDRLVFDRNCALVRARLGQLAFSAAWARGRQMSLEEVLELTV
jgi:predicted ATPase/DNA-binding SARP family transcriptional activator